MDNIVETLSVTFSLVTLFVTPIVLFIIIHLIKRNGFYVSVNCWFCNTWTKVLYAERNNFYCPSCLQYNGFDDDGGYNKVIEAQYDTSFSKYNKTTKETEPLVNGLCTYCNNNQQLKVYQLANFVPLNENSYNVEVEHFEKQLEKAYKLCKKCDNVLKTTIEKQNAWIFGNRLKSLRIKGLSLLNIKKSPQRIVKPIYLSVIKYIIVLMSVLIICYVLDITVNYRTEEVAKLTPDIFISYAVLLNDFYSLVSKTIDNGITEINLFLPKDMKLNGNNLLPISCMGLLLEIVILICDQRSIWWKLNEILGWILLVITSLIPFHAHYVLFVNALQVFCSIAIIYSLLSANQQQQKSSKKKFEFKKLKKGVENIDCSDIDEEVLEESNSSISSKKSSSIKSFKGNKNLNAFCCQSPLGASQGFSFQHKVQKTAKLNNSFSTARSTKTASIFNSSFKTASNLSSSSELNHSLDNLHLSNLNFKPQTCTSPVLSVNTGNRPILSPPKLKNIAQNSWTAGGFWKNEVTLFPGSTEFTNLSRSSSQTSGFVSNNDPVNVNPFSSLPPSREPSVCGDFERTSILSEPAYHFQPINSNSFNSCQPKNNLAFHVSQWPKSPLPPNSSQLYYKADNNMFYPVINQNNMLFFQGSNIPHNNFESSFSNLSLKGFNTNPNNNLSPPNLFSKQPAVSSLFKNLPGVSAQSHSFKTPHC